MNKRSKVVREQHIYARIPEGNLAAVEELLKCSQAFYLKKFCERNKNWMIVGRVSNDLVEQIRELALILELRKRRQTAKVAYEWGFRVSI